MALPDDNDLLSYLQQGLPALPPEQAPANPYSWVPPSWNPGFKSPI